MNDNIDVWYIVSGALNHVDHQFMVVHMEETTSNRYQVWKHLHRQYFLSHHLEQPRTT